MAGMGCASCASFAVVGEGPESMRCFAAGVAFAGAGVGADVVAGAGVGADAVAGAGAVAVAVAVAVAGAAVQSHATHEHKGSELMDCMVAPAETLLSRSAAVVVPDCLFPLMAELLEPFASALARERMQRLHVLGSDDSLTVHFKRMQVR